MSFNPHFFNEPQQAVSISAGITYLPCFFRKVHYTVCLFSADKEAVLKKLEGVPLVPSLKWRSKYVVAIGMIRYDNCDLGQYNEMIVSIPVVPQGIKPPVSSWIDLVASLDNRKLGQHIIHIPVTSEFSRAAGYELWGYPKIVAPVDHEFHPSFLHSKIFDPASKELIVEIKGKLGCSIPSIPLSLITYSFIGGKLMKTKVKVRGIMKLRLNHGLRLKIGFSNHPIANDLRMMDLDGKKPFLVMDTEMFQSVFYEAQPFDRIK